MPLIVPDAQRLWLVASNTFRKEIAGQTSGMPRAESLEAGLAARYAVEKREEWDGEKTKKYQGCPPKANR